MTTAPTATPTEAMPGLKGKNVLVTGGSSGIGQAIAVRFAEYGANVAINYLRQPDEASDTEEQVHACVDQRPAGGRPRRARPGRRLQGGRRRADGRQAVDGLGGLDVLVNNAGIQISRPVATSCRAPTSTRCSRSTCAARSCAPARRSGTSSTAASGGSIVNVSSVHQVIPKPDYLGYSARKGGMQNLTRTLALEYAGRGHPRQRHRPGRDGHADQPRLDRRPGQGRDGRGHIPMRRAGTADEMGGVAVLPRQRRRRLHHRPDDLRRRRPDALPELPRAVVVGVTTEPSAGGRRPSARTTSSAC